MIHFLNHKFDNGLVFVVSVEKEAVCRKFPLF